MKFELRALVACLSIAATACTSILGLTDVPDASVGEAPDGQVSTTVDAAGADGTVGAVATPDGAARAPSDGRAEVGGDAATPTPSDGSDAGIDVVTDAASVVTTVSCTPGGACSPNDCQNGTWACTDGGRVCQESTALPAGTPCGAGGDAGARVCSMGTCVACNAGADCSDPATPCTKKSVDCSAGTSQCKVTGKVADGTGCGTGLYCNAGACAACQVGASCTPAANACHVGKVTACSAAGVPTCTDQGTAAAAGTACPGASGGAAVCDAKSACVACTPGTQCNPSGNTCQVGVQSCSAGPECKSAVPVHEGQSCGTGAICHNGACGTCDATSCASGCCDTHGCVTTAQSPSECGNGHAGAACGACPAATAGTGKPACSSNACTLGCAAPTPNQCTGTCVDFSTDDKNCGACGAACAPGTKCSGGHCACNTTSGCAGCCSNASTCEPLANETTSSCGKGGAMCTVCSKTNACDQNLACTAGACVEGNPRTDTCTQGQRSCVSGEIAACTLSNGCLAYGTPTKCGTGTHQTCTGAAGSATCSCKADPLCSSLGNVCASSSGYATCAQDADKCFYQQMVTPCGNGTTCQGGNCVCGGSTPNQCGSTCTNLASDHLNCGVCGRTCLSGASAVGQCASSICQPFALQSIGPLTPPLLIDPKAVPLSGNATRLYATLSGNAAASIDAQTGSVVQSPMPIFGSSIFGGGLFSQNSTTLYALDNSGAFPRIVGIPKSSLIGSSVPYSQPAGFDSWLGVVGGSPEQICVYVRDDNSLQCEDGNQQAANLVLCTNGPDSSCQTASNLAADDGGLVWLSETFQGSPAASLLLAGPNLVNPTSVPLPANTRPGPIALDSSYAYWFDSNGGGLFYKTRRAAAGATTQISSTAILHAPVQLAVDSTYLYWTDTAVSTVSRVAIAAGSPTSPTVIATNQVGPTGIAVDGSAVYWINGSGGTLMKMLKPQ